MKQFLIFVYLILAQMSWADVVQMRPSLISKIPHHIPAFTQGLAFENDTLYESTGLYGQSSLRTIDLSNGNVLHQRFASPDLFTEGIAAFENRIIQITWKNHFAVIYDLPNLEVAHILFYSGEGWGLCRDGNTVWMSDGTSTLTQRDPTTLQPIRTIVVRIEHVPVELLNDLECVENEM